MTLLCLKENELICKILVCKGSKRKNKFFQCKMPIKFFYYFLQRRRKISTDAEKLRNLGKDVKIKNLKYKQIINVIEDRELVSK